MRYLAADSATNAEGPKGAVIGTEFYGRDATYDARYDSIVRVSVNRLRKCLRDFYSNEGKNDAFQIEVPRGAYAVVLVEASEPLEGQTNEPVENLSEVPVEELEQGHAAPFADEQEPQSSASAAGVSAKAGRFHIGYPVAVLLLLCVVAAGLIPAGLVKKTRATDEPQTFRRFERDDSHSISSNTVDANPTPVGSTSSQQTVITFPARIKLNRDPAVAIQVVTQGVANADFRYTTGGTCAAGKTYRAGQSCTVNFLFSPRTAGQRAGAVLMRDDSGAAVAVFTTYIARSGVGPHAEINPGVITSILGGPNHLGMQLENNQGLAIDPAGVMFVADAANQRVLKVTNGVAVPYGPHFSAPVALALDGAGNLYVADYDTDDVQMIERATGKTTVVPGATNLLHINGLAVDAAGNLYAPSDNVVRRFSPDGTARIIAGTGVAGYNGDGIPATTAQLNDPTGLAVDAVGNVYIVDTNNNRIRRIDPAGVISTIAGTGDPGFSGDGGPAVAAKVFKPSVQLCLDDAGDLFFSDTHNHRIRKITPSGTITTVAGNGTTNLVEGVAATSSGMDGNTGLACDAAGNLIESEDVANVVRRIAPAPTH